MHDACIYKNENGTSWGKSLDIDAKVTDTSIYYNADIVDGKSYKNDKRLQRKCDANIIKVSRDWMGHDEP